MLKMKLPVLIAAAALSLAASARLDDPTFTLKRVAKVGDTITYKLTVDAEFGGQKINVTAKTVDKVVKADDKEIQVESKQEETKIKFGDQEMDAPSEGASTTSYDARGLITDIKGENADSNAYRMANLTLVATPEKAVKKGDKWSHEFKGDDKKGSRAAKADYEVLDTEKVGGLDTVKVKWTYKETEGTEPASSEGTIWLHATDFSIVKVVGSLKGAPIPGAPAPMDLTYTLERS